MILSMSIKDKICFHCCGLKTKKVIGQPCNQISYLTVIWSLNVQVLCQAIYLGSHWGCCFTPQVSSCSNWRSALLRLAYPLHLKTMLPWVKNNHHPNSNNWLLSTTVWILFFSFLKPHSKVVKSMGVDVRQSQLCHSPPVCPEPGRQSPQAFLLTFKVEIVIVLPDS